MEAARPLVVVGGAPEDAVPAAERPAVDTISIDRHELEALRQSEAQLRQMAETIQDVFYLSDAATNRVIYVNPAFETIWGRPRSTLLQNPRSWFESVHPEDRARIQASIEGWVAEKHGPEWTEEFRIVRPDGGLRWIWVRSFPIRDASGRIVRFAGIERDITDRRQADDTVRSLLRITWELNSTFDVEALIEALVKETLRLVEADSGFAGLHGPDGMVTDRYFRGEATFPFRRRWRTDRGILGWIMAHRLPYVANDAAHDPMMLPAIRRRFRIVSAICSPLLDPKGEVIGFIHCHNKKQTGGFTKWDEEKLAAVSQAASVAVQNAQAYATIESTAAVLRLTERKYRGIFENAVEGIAQTTPDGRILTANPALARMLGYDSPEALLQGVTDVRRQLYVDPERRREGQAILDRQGTMSGFEAELYRRDGGTIWVSMNVRAVRGPSGDLIHYESTLQDITGRRRAEESLREVSGQLLRSQNEERRRIARELHDSTAQSLAALAMNLGVVGRGASRLEPAARRRLGDSQALARQCCRELRTLSYLLHPPVLDDGNLWSILRWYAQGFGQRSGIRVTLALPRKMERLPADVETTLFRIVQECLANVHRHSGSRSARIRVTRRAGGVVLEVEDRGRGLGWRGPADAHAALGVGIAGMRERVRQLGGRFAIDSSRRGTRVRVFLPKRAAD